MQNIYNISSKSTPSSLLNLPLPEVRHYCTSKGWTATKPEVCRFLTLCIFYYDRQFPTRSLRFTNFSCSIFTLPYLPRLELSACLIYFVLFSSSSSSSMYLYFILRWDVAKMSKINYGKISYRAYIEVDLYIWISFDGNFFTFIFVIPSWTHLPHLCVPQSLFLTFFLSYLILHVFVIAL